MASNFQTFSVHLFIDRKHHLFQQDFAWHAHIHLFISLLRNELVFFGTITGSKINGLHLIVGFVLPEMSEQSASVFVISNPASRIGWDSLFLFLFFFVVFTVKKKVIYMIEEIKEICTWVNLWHCSLAKNLTFWEALKLPVCLFLCVVVCFYSYLYQTETTAFYRISQKTKQNNNFLMNSVWLLRNWSRSHNLRAPSLKLKR